MYKEPSSVWSGEALLLGGSAPMVRLRTQAERVAREPMTVLIQGESGTGKRPLARGIHALSGRTGELVVSTAPSAAAPRP